MHFEHRELFQYNVVVFKVGKITVVGHVCFMIILSVKLQFTGNYVHLALVLEKAILEESLAEHLPLLSHIGFSLLKKIYISMFCK